MENAYNHLVTSLSVYGSKSASDNHINASTFIEASGILKEVQEKPKRTRPRKLTKQRRKVVNKTLDVLNTNCTSSGGNFNLFTNTAFSQTRKKISKKEDIVSESSTLDDITVLAAGNEENSVEANEAASDTTVTENTSKDSRNNVIVSSKRPSRLRVSGQRRQLLLSAFNLAQEKTADGKSTTVKKRGRPKLHKDDQVGQFFCSRPQCNFVTTKKSKLNTHCLQVHEATPIQCDLCTKVFLSKKYMLRHRASHTQPQHCCDVCGKMYKIQKAMLEHRKTHDAAYEKPKVSCDHCSKTFCNRYVLNCHIRDVHMGQKKSFLCATCGKSFTSRHSLTEHTNAHTGVKPHVCEICGKSFSYESALRDHRFSHEDSKQFWCKYCQKGFSQRSGLKMHMRIHRQNKMFVCNECGRGFTQKQALQRHERVHKGEKPFVCKHCGRLFTDASIIRRHLILVHKINKDAKAWREDIVCTVQSQNDYQVQRITDKDEAKDAERAKNELFVKAVGGAQPRASNKGPSRAFCRTYPRRVALLDDQGNVIAPPEIPRQPLVRKTQLMKIDNESASISVQNSQLILGPEAANANSRNSATILNQKYVEPSQWESVADHLVTGDAISHENDNAAFAGDTINQIEHSILEKPSHPGQSHLQNNFQKLIKHEIPCNSKVVTLSPGGVVSLNDASIKESNAGDPSCAAVVMPKPFIQQQQHIIKHHPHVSETTSSSGPLSFNAPSATGMVNQTAVENLSQQTDTSNNVQNPNHIQFYEGRPGGSKNVANWPSMFYYSQLASQFGMNINSEYPYSNAIVTSTSSPLRGIQICGQPSPPLPQSAGSAATTFILQGQPLPELDQLVGMKAGQGTAVIHLESCDGHQRTDQGPSELAISLQQGEPTADVQVRHFNSMPDAEELILLQQNLQHSQHHSQQPQQESSPTMLIGQRPSRYQQQLQHQGVDLVEHLTNTGNITSDQHNILVRVLDNENDHHSSGLQVPSREDSLDVLKEDI